MLLKSARCAPTRRSGSDEALDRGVEKQRETSVAAPASLGEGGERGARGGFYFGETQGNLESGHGA